MLTPAWATAATLDSDQAADGDASAPEAHDADVDGTTDDLIVTAERGPNSAQTDVAPDQVLDEAAIASYGASNAAELIANLSVQTRSGRGRGGGFPIILVNGRRVSGFGEIRNLPSEAIGRVEILPEEAAIDYGFSPDQRVINFILKDNFAAVTTEVEGGLATDGGRSLIDTEASLLRLRGRSRLNLTGNYNHQSALTEAERDIVQLPGGDGDLRTLLPSADNYSIDGTFALPVSTRTGASLNLRYDQTSSASLLGASPVSAGEALSGRNRGETIHAGASADGRLGAWRWSLTGNYDDGRARASSERADPAAPTTRTITDTTRTHSQTADLDAVLSGRLFALPAGPVRTTLQAGWRDIGFEATAVQNGTTTLTDLSRTALTASSNIDLPIASRNDNVLSFIGDLSANGRIAIRDVSDFRTLTSWTAGFNWGPFDGVNITLNWVGDENAPGVSQLGAPALVTTGRTIFDFVRGETVLASVTSGGNPDLLAETRRDFRLQGNWRPIAGAEFLVTASYARTMSRNTTANFPLLTPEIEAAFPDRVTRDSSGRLIAVDQRQVNFAQTRGRQLRYGFNFSRPFGLPAGRGPFGAGGPPGARPPGGAPPGGVRPPSPPPAAATGAPQPPAAPAGAPQPPAPSTAAAPATPPAAIGAPTATGPAAGPQRGPAAGPGAGPPGGPRRGGGPGGFGGMFGGGSGGRWSVGLFHTIRFEDEVLIRPGVPVLDLLNGSATGAGGGSPRHVVELDGGWFYRGLGVRAIGSWTDGSTVTGGPVAGGGTASDLRFSPQMTINLRLFVDLGQQGTLAERHPVTRNMRLRLAIDNLFNDRQTVRDASGVIPLRYQPGFIEPQGRTVQIELRKQF